MLILADRDSLVLRNKYASCAADLRKISPKLLLIQPHILLFQSETDLLATFDTLPTSLRQGDQAILMQVLPGFRGFALGDRVPDLQNFFQVS